MGSRDDQAARGPCCVQRLLGDQRLRLAARLSSHGWSKIVIYLISAENVPADVRPSLVDAALRAADPDGGFAPR